jgi:hypothetical protein
MGKLYFTLLYFTLLTFQTTVFQEFVFLSDSNVDAGFEPASGHVGFVVEKAAQEYVFSECFGFP